MGHEREGHAGGEASCEINYGFCAASGLALIAITVVQTQEAAHSSCGPFVQTCSQELRRGNELLSTCFLVG